MNSFSRKAKFLLVAWLCLFSLVDLKAFSNLVLCLGPDGHIELEIAVDDRCGAVDQTTRPAFSALIPADEKHCGDCADIPLISNSVAEALSHQAVAAAGSESDPFCMGPSRHALSHVKREMKKASFSPPPAPTPLLSSLGSVRLLV